MRTDLNIIHGGRLSLRALRLCGGISLLALVLFAVGCAPKGVVKDEKPSDGIPGQAAPSLAEAKLPVTEEAYQAALSKVGNEEVGRQNLESHLTLAQYRYNHSQLEEALKTYQKAILFSAPATLSERAHYMVGQIYYDKRAYLPALSAFQVLVAKSPKSLYGAQARRMMEFILGQSMDQGDLQKYVANYPDSPMICFALFQLGSQEVRSSMTAAALEHLGRVVQECPNDPLAADAQLLVRTLQERQAGKTWKVAILAPLSGQYRGLGESVVNGVKMALEQANETGGSQKTLSVVIRDTRGDSIQAVNLFQDLVKDGSLDAVIGPVRAREIEAVAPLAAENKVTLFSPSMTRDGLSLIGPGLFNNGITNEMQGRAIARYAVEKLGLKRFGILSPADGYGETLAASFRKTVESMGATILVEETYPPGATDFKRQLITLGGQDPDASKENEKENKRRFDSLDYSMGKEVGKMLLRNRELAGAATGSQVAAFVPLTEFLGNSLCPSLVDQVNANVREALADQPGLTLRNDDLIQQALERLPEEAKGTTLPASADLWAEVFQELQCNLLITGRVLGAQGVEEGEARSTWDYSIQVEAIRLNSKKGTLSRIHKGTLTYRAYKDPTLTRADSNFQALYLPAHAPEVPLLASQIHFYDLSPVFLGGHLWEAENVLDHGKKEVEGSYFPTGFFLDSSRTHVRKFAEDYQRRYSARPDLLAAQAFDAARMFLMGLDGSSDREDLPRRLLSIRDFDGVTGKTSFDGKAEAEKVVPILRIKNGKYEQVQ